MTIADGLIVFATLLSPLIAVQVQKWIERSTERRDAQRQLFYDLMATRATRVAAKHVEALNRIDLEFHSKHRAEREVLNRWRIYADHLNVDVDEGWSPSGTSRATNSLLICCKPSLPLCAIRLTAFNFAAASIILALITKLKCGAKFLSEKSYVCS